MEKDNFWLLPLGDRNQRPEQVNIRPETFFDSSSLRNELNVLETPFLKLPRKCKSFDLAGKDI
jgi:hypothetical protein